jgi:hypothetical protein
MQTMKKKPELSSLDLIDLLQALTAGSKQDGLNRSNEESTKMPLVTPFTQALGFSRDQTRGA